MADVGEISGGGSEVSAVAVGRGAASDPVLYAKVGTYNLKYRDRKGKPKPVRFGSYIWKRIDGLAIGWPLPGCRTIGA
jgi:hypothetical protein